MEIDERLAQVFRSVFDDESLKVESHFTADNIDKWDSLNHINLIFAVEEEFGITLGTRELEQMECVGDLQACIERKGAL
ncbi:acyl carrier protein [Marinobacter bryozoorum]|uniref:acyl carrier protein n=1 Tax=Marinobacter bryozoorum TaxID=256324 RepID=UPI0020048CFA|nr:acyl carrier protein [Marinobacter bryozoorum]MCK7546196.1 acyl carrier protein [Marinobacter bryozoorum]